MNEIEQTLDKCLMAIGADCQRLLFALQQSPEAVWNEILRMESACHAFNDACSGLQDKSTAHEIMTLIGALRVQMAKDGLIDHEERAAFRQGVSAIKSCADQLRILFGGKGPRSNRRLKTCVFYCSNNLDAARLASLGEEMAGETVKTIGLPCSGKVDVPYLIKALETGADGVVVVACPKSECRHFEGSARAHKRVEAVESLLEEIGFGAGRMAVIECAKDGAGQVCAEIKHFIEKVRSLPQARIPSGAVNKQEQMVA